MSDARIRHWLRQIMKEIEFSEAITATGGFKRMMALRKRGSHRVHLDDEDAMLDLTAVVMQRVEEDTSGKLTAEQMQALTGVVTLFMDAAYVLGKQRGEIDL